MINSVFSFLIDEILQNKHKNGSGAYSASQKPMVQIGIF